MFFDILFIYPPYEKRPGGGTIFPLGIGYLISGIKNKGFSFDYIDCQNLYCSDPDNFVKNLTHRMIKNQYLVIAISSITTAAVPFLNNIITACRRAHKNTPIILGGQLVSIDYVGELFFREYNIDAICRGDGDYAIPELVQHIKGGNPIESFMLISTKDRVAERNYINDINSLPFPYRNREIVSNTRMSFGRSTYEEKSLPMITSRGCIYKCYYCVSGCNTGNHFKKRTWENIVSEIKYLQDKFQVYSIVFYDDCFFYNKKTVNDDINDFICQLIKQNCDPFKWQIELRADIIATISPESWKKLYEYGCHQINVGIESCYDDTLMFLGKSLNTQTIEKAFEYLEKYAPKIILTATYIVGGPNTDLDHILNLASFSKKIKLMYINIYPLELHPGTKLYEQYYKKQDDWYRFIINNNSYSCMYFEHNIDSLNKIKENIKRAYKLFYLDGYWDQRAKNIYGERYSIVKENLKKVYNLEEE